MPQEQIQTKARESIERQLAGPHLSSSLWGLLRTPHVTVSDRWAAQ